MTSFADDNRNILKSGKTGYNGNIRQPIQMPAENTAEREYVRQTEYVRNENDSSYTDEIKKLYRKIKQQRRIKNDKFEKENETVIRNTFLAGTKKVDYSYKNFRIKQKQKDFPVGVLGIAAAITLVVMLLIRIYTFMAMYTTSINELKKEINEYKAQRNELVITLGKQQDNFAIDEYAEAHGMVRAEQLETSYIRMSDTYVIEKNEEKEDEYAINTVMSGVSRLLGGALDN